MRRLAVIGAGPIGLEAALYGVEKGFEVTVFEAGEVGQWLRNWGPTRFFTPLSMNLSARARAALGEATPEEGALLTGPEMAEKVLQPLSQSVPLAGKVRTQHKVLAVGRSKMNLSDRPRHPLRHERSFRLLVEGPEQQRFYVTADRVLDASGLCKALPVGGGGLPALGEEKASPRILDSLGEIYQARGLLRNQRILLVGTGHSAANAMVWLHALALEAPKTRVHWATRTIKKLPLVQIAQDPLPERVQIVNQANEWAAKPPEYLTMLRKTQVEHIETTAAGLKVTLDKGEPLEVDYILGLAGRRPDHALSRELGIELSPVSEGSRGIERALSSITDCLSVPKLKPEDLASGEPGFALLGSKSYGRLSTFLLQSGREQLETVIDGF